MKRRYGWSEEETNRLLGLWEQGLTRVEIARRLGRSLNSIRDRLALLGVQRMSPRNPPVPKHVRIHVAETLTGQLMGDPPLYRSALGQKMGMQA